MLVGYVDPEVDIYTYDEFIENNAKGGNLQETLMCLEDEPSSAAFILQKMLTLVVSLVLGFVLATS